MGRIARVLSFARRLVGGAYYGETKVDPDGGSNITGEHFSTPGDDSPPLDGVDYALLVKVQRSGGYAVAGYIDPANEGEAVGGEKRFYARNGNGAVVCTLWLKADGSIRGENDSGYFELESGGDFVANGAKMTSDGDVVTSDNISLRNHVHGGVTTGAGTTGGPQ